MDFRSTNWKYLQNIMCQCANYIYFETYLLKHFWFGPWIITHVVSLRQKKLTWCRTLKIVHWKLEQGTPGTPGMFGKVGMPGITGVPVIVMPGIVRSPSIKKAGYYLSQEWLWFNKLPDSGLCNLCLGEDWIKSTQVAWSIKVLKRCFHNFWQKILLILT